MSKRFLVSLIVIALSVAVIGAGTFAWFQDTETSDNNTMTAGSLDLLIKSGGTWYNGTVAPGVNADFGTLINNLKPGDGGSLIIPVKNDGSLPGTPTFKLNTLVQAVGSGVEAEIPPADTAVLAAAVQITVQFDGVDVAGGTGTLASLQDAVLSAPAGALGAGAEKNWTVKFKIDGPSVGNEIMGDTATCNVEFGLLQ